MTTGQHSEADEGAAISWKVEYPEPVGRFLHHDGADHLMHISLQLAAELWVVKRRLAEVEAQLVDRGSLTSPDTVPRERDFTFDPSERDRFVQGIFGALVGPDDFSD